MTHLLPRLIVATPYGDTRKNTLLLATKEKSLGALFSFSGVLHFYLAHEGFGSRTSHLVAAVVFLSGGIYLLVESREESRTRNSKHGEQVMDCPSCGHRLDAGSLMEVPARALRLFSGRMFCRHRDAEVAYTAQSDFLFAGLAMIFLACNIVALMLPAPKTWRVVLAAVGWSAYLVVMFGRHRIGRLKVVKAQTRALLSG